MSLLHGEALVKELMMDQARVWNVDLIRNIFLEEEATTIFQKPISEHRRRDKLIWGLMANGMFT